MPILSINAISPVDGRYRNHTEILAAFFSEGALIKYRVMVEIEYFIALCEIPLSGLEKFDKKFFADLRKIYLGFTDNDALRVKEIEKVTNHDVKAVEYFIKEYFDSLGLAVFKEFIHFGLTSQDINNTSLPLSLKDAWREAVSPLLDEISAKISKLSNEWMDIPMLARTHGQPASPTRLGKELYVFVERLSEQRKLLDGIPFSGKLGGATGNFNAHYAAYPDIDWISFANKFVTGNLGIKRQQTTTQIEHYDNMAAFFDGLKRINTILIDLNRDMWSYISMGYFRQRIEKGEVGSSAMPHKVNPIDFENSEGNLGIANALCEHLSSKLPISRLQRDLTDSTVTRNIGLPLAYGMISYRSLLKGLGKLSLNAEAIQADLDSNWAVVSEGIQTILRRHGYDSPYELLKDLTRTHGGITKESILGFIEALDVSDTVKAELKALSPSTYVGIKPIIR